MRQVGPFALGERLATSDLGELFLGVDPRGRRAVVDVLREELREDAGMLAIRRHAARLLALLDDERVERLLAADDEGRWRATALVDGASAGEIVKTSWSVRRERLSLEAAAHIFRGCLRALQYVHDATAPGGAPLGVVHRGVSPAALLVARHGHVVLGGFDLARSTLQEERTAPGVVKGRIEYLSPEAVLGKPLDGRADLFAAGVTFFELLTSRRAFAEDSFMRVLERVIKGDVGDLRAHRPDVPAELAAVIEAATATNADDRVASAAELLALLEDACARAGVRPRAAELPRLVAALAPPGRVDDPAQDPDVLPDDFE